MRLFILLICFCTSVSAQNRLNSVHEIREIVVTSKRSIKERGITKTAIDSTEFADSNNASFAELLAKHSPVFIKTYGLGSLATVSFRGTDASHTQVEWNGLNINNPMMGQVDFSMIPVCFIDKTELLHGGSSLQEGGGALGGSIITGSSPQWNKSLYGSIMQGIGSFANYQTALTVGGGNNKIQAKIRYMYQQAENDFSFFNNAVLPYRTQKQTNADYKKHGIVTDLYYNAGKGNYFSVNTWFNDAKRNLPTIMSYEGLKRIEYQKDNDIRIVGKWGYFYKNIKSELISGFSSTSLDYYSADNTNLKLVVNYDTKSKVNSWQNKYKLEYSINDKTMLRAVANATFHKVTTQNNITQEGYSINRADLGISLSAHHRINSFLSGYLLIRQENKTSLMPSLGLEVEPYKHIILKVNATKNYHKPTLNDLYWLPGGNPNLKPEKGYSTDLSAEYSLPYNQWSTTFGATGFYSKITNWIVWSPSDFMYWTPKNVKTVLSRGVELFAQAEYHQKKVKYSIRGNYAFTKTTNEDSDLIHDESNGKQLMYIPLHKFNMMFSSSYKGFYLNYTCYFTSERFTNSSNARSRHKLPAYDLHNITFGKTWKGLDAQLKVDNLFNKNYQAILWRAMPKRNYTLLIKYSF